MYDPLGARFRNAGKLEPWQKSAGRFDFNEGFVGWVQSYLEVRKQPHDNAAARAWINVGFFKLERLELVHLQWSAYQEHQANAAPPRPDSESEPNDPLHANPVPSGAPSPAVDSTRSPSEPPLTGEQRARNLKRLRELINKNMQL